MNTLLCTNSSISQCSQTTSMALPVDMTCHKDISSKDLEDISRYIIIEYDGR